MATLRALSLPRTLCGGALTPAAPRRAAAGLPAARSGSGRRTCGLLRPAASTWEGGSDQLSLGIVGDLHLEAGPQMALFEEAREHLKAALCDTKGAPLSGARVVQLGDLGAYAAKPGSQACFNFARGYLHGLSPLPYSLVTGNHDLEGFDDFSSDAENLEAWRRTFGQHHYWAVKQGAYLLIGLSTVRFRDAPGSCHEVYIDPEQLAWFEETLQANRGTPTLVFSHAPPMGCGLRALPAVHVKNRCAWLNHGESNAVRFSELTAVNPQVKLWFSGHFHLSHDYSDSLSINGECAFVQVGVIGATASRDGRRHSRLLRADSGGYQLYTVDHSNGGSLRLDLSRSLDAATPTVVPPAAQAALSCDPAAGWLCVPDACPLPPRQQGAWLPTGTGELTVQEGALVEYEGRTRAPLGVVVKRVAPGSRVRLVGADGRAAEGAAAVAVEIVAEDGVSLVERVDRAANGYFYRTFQENKYRMWQRAQALKREEALRLQAAAASAPA